MNILQVRTTRRPSNPQIHRSILRASVGVVVVVGHVYVVARVHDHPEAALNPNWLLGACCHPSMILFC